METCGNENFSNCSDTNKNDDILVQKKELRKKAKEELKKYFSDSELANQCKKTVANYFLKSKEYFESKLIFAYMAMNDEVDLFPIIEKSLKDGKKVAIPRMKPNSNDMDFYLIDQNILKNEQFSTQNKYKIREPIVNNKMNFAKKDQNTKIEIAKIPENSIFLVPGLAFNLQGARLGRGKGYYDKYLSQVLQIFAYKHIIFCGVCTVNVITKQIPLEQNDIKMNYLLTEYGFIKTK